MVIYLSILAPPTSVKYLSPRLMSSARSTSLLGLHYAVWDNDHAWLRELLEEEEPAADGNALSDRLEALDPQRCASSHPPAALLGPRR